MATLFNRVIEVTITSDKKKEGKTFTDLRMSFEIVKDSDITSNSGKVTIYNLNNNSITLLEEKNLKIIVLAGYKGTESVLPSGKVVSNPITEIIGVGDITHVETKKSGADKITVIEFGDGEKSLNESTMDKSYPGGITKKQIVDDLMGTFGMVKGAIEEVGKKVFNKGFSATGKSSDTLKEVLKTEGLEFSVQDEKIQIIKSGSSTKQESIVISSKTGLLSTPARKKGGDGITFTSLLNPQIKVGRIVKVVSEFAEGFYIVQKCSYSGDNHGGDFVCKAEAK